MNIDRQALPAVLCVDVFRQVRKNQQRTLSGNSRKVECRRGGGRTMMCVLGTGWKRHFKEEGVLPGFKVADRSSKMTDNRLLDLAIWC